ncbi:MAG TPA: asparaginase [Gaiellaceae bacterium]|nr:asparaginase [Gaiellaceae bacterium]
MAEPLSVAVRRGEIVESVHRVHAVAVRDGAVVAEAGDPALPASLRSSAKPIQALPLARARDDLTTDDLAISAASHFGTPMHVEAVRALLRKTRGSEDELECGLQPGRPPEPVYHNCSGKHAAMIAVCRARGWPVAGYFRADHPLQLEIAGLMADTAATADIATGIDGCGVPCFAVPLERAAFAFSRLPGLDGGDRIAAAMRARPDLVGGDGGTDTELMRLLPGWIAKGGAEGLMCAASPDGIGLAVKVADGNSRAIRPALAAFGEALGLDLAPFAQVPLENSHGEPAANLAKM